MLDVIEALLHIRSVLKFNYAKLSPSNVVINDGKYKIIDFYDEYEYELDHCLGNPFSRENFKNRKKNNEDVYSLAMLIATLLTGIQPNKQFHSVRHIKNLNRWLNKCRTDINYNNIKNLIEQALISESVS